MRDQLCLTRSLLVSVVLSFLILNSNVQAAGWEKTFGGESEDGSYSVQQTTDGGYIAAGWTHSAGAGGSDVYLVKTDGSGDLQWEKTFGGIHGDRGYSVQQTEDGGYVIAGETNSFGHGYSDVYLIKTDSSGNLLWEKALGSDKSEGGYSVQQTTDGGYIISGWKYFYGGTFHDVYLIKTDASGNRLWHKTFGGPKGEVGWCVRQTEPDGGYIIAGIKESGTYDAYLIKTDASGNLLWEKIFGKVETETAYSVQQTTDGGYIIVGYTDSFSGDDVYLVKTDASGDLLWEKILGGGEDDRGYSVQQTTDGGYIIAGDTRSFGAGELDAYLVKTDGSGDPQWQQTFGGKSNERGYSVRQTADGGYITSGWTKSFGAGNYDVYLIRYSFGEPVADANGPYSGSEGSSISFDGTGSYDTDGITVSYDWDFGDGNTGTGETLTYTYADNGVYAITLVVTDDDGLTGTDSTTATVDNVAPVVEAGADQTVGKCSVVCFSGSFSDPGSADTHTVHWDFGDGRTAIGTLTPTHIYVDAGVYTATLTVTDDDGGVGTDTLIVTVNEEPVANPGGPYTGDEGSPISFDGTGSYDPDGTIVSYDWDFGDGNTGTGPTPIHTYVDNPEPLDVFYTVTLTVTDDDGLQDTNSTIAIVSNVAPSVYSGSDKTVVKREEVHFSGSFTDPGSADTHTIEWDFGDGSPPVTETLDPTHVYENTGDFIVALKVTDDDDGVGTDTLIVTVKCPMGVISSDSVVLDELRQFRDHGLAKNETGQELIQLYYLHSREVADILMKHPMLLMSGATILKDVMPGIRFLLGNRMGRNMVMTHHLVVRITKLFEDIGKEGSEEIVQTLSVFSDMLEKYAGMRFSQIWQLIDKGQPEAFALLQNHPNPFNPDTWMPYQLKDGSEVAIWIYGVAGNLVRKLDLGQKPAGFYAGKDKAAYWDGRNEAGEQVASGVYFYTIQAGEFTATKKMIVAR